MLIAACGDSESGVDSSPTAATNDPSNDQALDMQGHRGARGLRPENTLPSFEAALDIGVTTLELDVHFSADGQIVIWHDAEIESAKCGLAPTAPDGIPDPDDPTVGGQNLMIRALTAEQLGWYRCDRNPDADRFPDQVSDGTELAGDAYAVVTLGRLFEVVEVYGTSDEKTERQRAGAADVRFNIETKRKPNAPETIGDGFDGANVGPFERELLRVIEDYGLEDRVVIQSFDHRSLWAIHAAEPSITLAALSTRPIDFDNAASQGASIWSPSHTIVTSTHISAAEEAGLLVIPWTVNDPVDMAHLIGIGVDGLITDRPDLLVSLVSGE